MNKLGTFKNCFLYSIELWVQNIIDNEIEKRELDYNIFASIDETPNGDIWLTIDDYESYSYIVGNTGCGCKHEKLFSGVDNIYELVSKALLDYFNML